MAAPTALWLGFEKSGNLAIFTAIRRASSFGIKFAACLIFQIGRVRIFHPVLSNRVGIRSRCCSSRHPSCCSSHHPSRIRYHPICRAGIFHPVPSNRVGTEHRQA
jgi:hypothetical protein